MEFLRNTKKERGLIALGGLLHDIGKFLQRTETVKKVQNKEFFGYAHASLSYQLAKEILDFLKITDRREREFVLSACFHHKPDTKFHEVLREFYPIRVLFRLADWYGSVERSKETEDETIKEFKRLRPVFETVDIGKGRSKEPYFYKLAPLSLKEEKYTNPVFPISRSQAKEWFEEEATRKEFLGDYEKLFNEFSSKLKVNEVNKEFKTLSHKLSYIYHLLYKYTWCVPASIYDRENYSSHYPDISLFDHSRVVSALATSLYTEENLKIFENFKGNIQETGEKLKLVIFEGDISGIQKFIYDITNIKGVAKRLRGRSVFLSFLPELIGRFILRELNYPWTNLLYAGGGKFQAIVGYENGIEEKLQNIAKKVEEVLLKTFGGKLGFVIYYHTFKLSDTEKYSEIVKELLEKGTEAKKRKFLGVLNEFEKLANKKIKGPIERCPSCRWELMREGNETCDICEDFKNLGDAVVKSNVVLFTKEKKNLKGAFLENIGGIYLVNNLSEKEEYEDAFLINKPEEFEKYPSVTGFRFLANVVPKDEEGIKSLEELDEEIDEGDKKLAYVLADVDNLGYIFMEGLGKKYTISRVATLSRSLDLFFSGYLNKLFEKYENKIYTVYAGGDDLFIIAPWDTAIEVMQKVREEFKEYTCENPSFGLSCGMFITTGNYPVRLAYESVKKAEDRAKENEGKDSVCVLEEVLKWNELERALEEAKNIVDNIKNGNIPRTSFYKIYLLLRQYREYEKEVKDEKYMFYPMFFYFVKRNIKKDFQEKFVNFFLDENKEVKKNALFLAKYSIMKTRNVRSSKVEAF